MPQWYEESFGEDYLIVYRHRNKQMAAEEVQRLAKWLNLSERDLVLDLCCGTGRHSISLAKLGFHVVGLDLSKTLLRHAVRDSEGMRIPFVHGDMRHLPFMEHSFDVVVNLFTSFGYFAEDRENRQVLTEIRRVLKPDGRFLIDYLNREAVKQKLVPLSERTEGDTFIREERAIEGDFVVKRIYIRDKRGERSYLERVKMYSREQMEEMIVQAGLGLNAVYGNFEGEAYHPLSDRMIFVGRVKE
jgi:SAM-dependent methyltransferase